MRNDNSIVLGVNHMFLYPDSIVQADVHTRTLGLLAQTDRVDALDCWVWADHAKEEIEILRNSGKYINYNIGDRFGETPVFPATTDPRERQYALDMLRRESDFAVACGAKKIIFGSGKDVPECREDALKRFVDFIAEWKTYIPDDICLALEPTDRDVDKHFLLGSLEDTCWTVQALRDGGIADVGILLDMGHIPLMHETLASAAEKTKGYLRHIHMGNCIVKDPTNPMYGDKHPCWGAPGGEYDETDGAEYLRQLKKFGYFDTDGDKTLSFEMRTLTGMDEEQTLNHLTNWFHRTLAEM